MPDDKYTPESFRDEINRRRRESGKFDPDLGTAATEGPEGAECPEAWQGPIETDRTPDDAFRELEQRLASADAEIKEYIKRYHSKPTADSKGTEPNHGT